MNAVEYMKTHLFAANAKTTKINLKDIPKPEDKEIICGETILCVNRHNTLNVKYDFGSIEFSIDNDETLFTCMMHAFSEYWAQNDKHYPMIHPSWYVYIESYTPKFIQYWK